MRIPKSYYKKHKNYINTIGILSGDISPELVFSIRPTFKFMELEDTPTLVSILKRFYDSVATYCVRTLVGDPRVGGSPVGVVPRGGTGNMRLFTRVMIIRQMNKFRADHAEFYIGIPVGHGKRVEGLTTQETRHTGMGRRIIGYRAGKPVWGNVALNDPEAGGTDTMYGGFFEELVVKARQRAAVEIKHILDRYTISYKDVNLYLILEPDEFRVLVT